MKLTTLVVKPSTTKRVGRFYYSVSSFRPVLSEVIKQLRKTKGWTQAQLADESRVSQQLIGKIETGKVFESKKLPRIAAALGMKVEDLLKLAAGGPVEATSKTDARTRKEKSGWPFKFSPKRWNDLLPRERSRIEAIVLDMVRAFESDHRHPDSKSRGSTAQRRKAG